LFVLDEPSVGLHPRDTERLVRILQQLRDGGNTVLVVEHEASVIRAADQIIDLGPGHGATGGAVMFQGSYQQILRSKESLTGQYLAGRKQIEIHQRRPVHLFDQSRLWGGLFPSARAESLVLNDAPARAKTPSGACPMLKLAHATRHNLEDLAVEIPLGRFVCITGVSGSGKSTLVRDVLLPALGAALQSALPARKASERLHSDISGRENSHDISDQDAATPAAGSTMIEGHESLRRVILVDQSILGKTPRSNPAVYIGAFDDIREVFAQSEVARQRGLNASAFSFNSSQGQCERCRGAGFEKIEMQFLSDIFIRCPDCNGRRYRSHILQVKLGSGPAALSIADLLDASIEDAVEFLARFTQSKPAQRARRSLALLQEVGLGYLKLGQPINTLSGGESQRLKLVKHLVDSVPSTGSVERASNSSQKLQLPARHPADDGRNGQTDTQTLAPGGTLFLFDEPTTGLHFDDVRVLLKVFQRLVTAGDSVVVIEHNLDVIKSADWLIDLGPDAGDQGGRIVTQGTPEQVAACDQSHTGRALREVLRLNSPSPLATGKVRSLELSNVR
jgi:excinuclease ABC subunit A